MDHKQIQNNSLLTSRYYLKARDVLNKYKHMPSFQGIHVDCEAIVEELMQTLKEQLRNPAVSIFLLFS